MGKRKLDIVVISDLHLGNPSCHAKELLTYLKRIEPGILILNGDIIDQDQIAGKDFSESHKAIVTQILKMATQGVKVFYLSGNHDKPGEGQNPLLGGPVIFRKHLELVIDQKKYWIFHGDIFDAGVATPHIAKLGILGYRNLIKLNALINHTRDYLGLSRLSLASSIKSKMGQARKYIAEFERIICHHALRKDCDVVICGHIHVPVIKQDPDHDLMYLNSGDWVENLTALEYQNHQWKIHFYDPADYVPISKKLMVSRKRRPAQAVAGKPGTSGLPVNSKPTHRKRLNKSE